MMDPVPRKNWKVVVPESKLPFQLVVGLTAVTLGIGAEFLYITFVIPHWPTSWFLTQARSDIGRWAWGIFVFLAVSITWGRCMFALREMWWTRTHESDIAKLPNNQ